MLLTEFINKWNDKWISGPKTKEMIIDAEKVYLTAGVNLCKEMAKWMSDQLGGSQGPIKAAQQFLIEKGYEKADPLPESGIEI